MQIKFTPIIPQPIKEDLMKHQFINAMRDLGVEIRENFEDTTRSWNHQPRFDPPTAVPTVGIDKITVETTTEDQRYKWVSEGTKGPYPITAVNAKTLAFPSQFIPKTFPGIISSGVGFSGSVDKFPKKVLHPGVEPRKFVETIKVNQEKNAKTLLERAMLLARKASGHAL